MGFAQWQLWHDYVEGMKSSPVGYLEGVFVLESHRNKGIALQLLQRCEEWATEKMCTKFESDCEITNEESAAFLIQYWFQEANRVICCTKAINPGQEM